MDKIKKKIDNTVYWIRIDKKKSQVLVKGNSKKETGEKLKKMAKIDNNLDGAIIYRIIIKIHKKKRYDTCILSFNFDNYKIKKGKLKKISLDGKSGYIWFEEDWLLENGWNKKYISNTVNKLKSGKSEIIIPGINLYQLF